MRISCPPARLLACLLAAAGCSAGMEDSLFLETGTITVDVNAVYTLVGVQSGKCVEVQSGSTTAGARLDIATCASAPRQQWRAESMGAGLYRLRNVNSGLCADVSGASTTDGAAVIQWACGTGANQQWSFADVSSGIERITARHSGKVMDVTGHATADGTLLEQWTSNAGANQQFRVSTMGSGGGAGGSGGAASSGGSGGTSTDGSGGSTTMPGKVFSACRFHFGTTDHVAKANPSMIPQLDFFTPGWMGFRDTFDMGYLCTEGNPGGVLAKQVPVVVAYVAAFYAKRHFGRCDCNVSTCGPGNDLCHFGASDILNNLPAIINVYKSYAQGLASCYGTTRPIVFEMEPDWYQYVGSAQTKPMTKDQAGTLMSQFVDAVKQFLPNAVFSMDISPWVGSNGADNGAEWYSHFDMSKFTFINTSGGGTNAATARIRASNQMTWAGVHQVTGKPILADTGYGANGVSAGPDPNWDVTSNINARLADGVASISQYNAAPTWGSTITDLRAQLRTPLTCP